MTSRPVLTLLRSPRLPLAFSSGPRSLCRVPCPALRSFASARPVGDAALRRTPLYGFHVAEGNGAKIVPFAGYEMPLSYSKSGGQVKEHLAVRTGCGLFDVSHMVQHVFRGPQATEYLSLLLPTALASMPTGASSLSVLLNNQGGIIDDCMITRWGEDQWYLVTNAGRRAEDLAWIQQHLGAFPAVTHEVLEDWGLVALQGPEASQRLQPMLTPDQNGRTLDLNRDLFFGQGKKAHLSGVEVHISRGGYTGEDGFEISIPPSRVEELVNQLAAQEGVTLCGLAARDSLRLEAGLCLYGHDLDETVGTGEAGLGWTVGKERAGFIGEERTRAEKGDKIRRRRVGLVVEKGPPAREGAKIVNEQGEEVGAVTSGIPSPTLGQNIALAYVKTGWHKSGTGLQVLVRGKARKAEVVKMPFVEARYYRAPK